MAPCHMYIYIYVYINILWVSRSFPISPLKSYGYGHCTCASAFLSILGRISWVHNFEGYPWSCALPQLLCKQVSSSVATRNAAEMYPPSKMLWGHLTSQVVDSFNQLYVSDDMLVTEVRADWKFQAAPCSFCGLSLLPDKLSLLNQ